MNLLFLVVGFFVLTVALAWLLLFPAGRGVVAGAALTSGTRASVWTLRWMRDVAGVFGGAGARVYRAVVAVWEYVCHNRWILAIVVLLMCVPPLLVTQLHYDLDFQGISLDSEPTDQAQITRLLRGPTLAPPPPVVPAAFKTREVELVRPTLPHANREWDRLRPEFRQRLLAVYKLMQEKYGYNMVLIEGYRSPQRQRQLARNKPDVTNAGAFESYHQYGLAADSAFMRNGELVISADSDWAMRGYRLYGRLAEAAGLTWGGEWQLHDYGHVELRRPGVLR